jgi:hypothetical protein
VTHSSVAWDLHSSQKSSADWANAPASMKTQTSNEMPLMTDTHIIMLYIKSILNKLKAFSQDETPITLNTNPRKIDQLLERLRNSFHYCTGNDSELADNPRLRPLAAP